MNPQPIHPSPERGQEELFGPPSGEETIEGRVERVVFANEETGYTVVRLKKAKSGEPLTVVGNLGNMSPGEEIRVGGEWTTNKRFGLQFSAKTCEVLVPTTIEGIRGYLGSGLIKGIGPVMAERIVAKFGLDTLEVIEKQPRRLREVEGIGQKKLADIQKAWSEQREIRNIMLFLQAHAVSVSLATRIFRTYGSQAVSVLKTNPYQVADDVRGIGFKTADQIAEKLGIPKDSPLRARSGILHVLSDMSGDGHCFYPERGLVSAAAKLLEVDAERVAEALESLQQEARVILEKLTDGDTAIYVPELYHAEASIAESLGSLLRAAWQPVDVDVPRALSWLKETLQIDLQGGQREAFENALRSKVLVVTGGPGTGKTTIVRSIAEVLGRKGRAVALAAPTGRASRRLSETCRQDASTVHRLLEFNPHSARFMRNSQRPIEADIVVVDEASMLDLGLTEALLQAIHPSAALLLVGDADQLPSVGPGSVLADIIQSGVVPVVRLTEIYRQSARSAIVLNAHRINHGQIPYLNIKAVRESASPQEPTGENLRELEEDFFFIEKKDSAEAPKVIINLCTHRIPDRFGLDPFADIQVISPMHKGTVGVENLNHELQAALNPQEGGVEEWGRFRVGDKVMQTRNNYEYEVFNGDLGRVTAIDHESRELQVKFDEKTVIYEFNAADELILGYAISVHKSQGSEYPAVVMPLFTEHYMLLQRNLLYTAVTRAKRLLVIVGTRKALNIAISNDTMRQRFSRLKERLESISSPADCADLRR